MIWTSFETRRNWLLLFLVVIWIPGCGNDAQLAEQARRKQKQVLRDQKSTVDHLADAYDYISRMVELDSEAATRQITYHLNAWLNIIGPKPSELGPLAKSIEKEFPSDMGMVRPASEGYLPVDIEYFRQCYLLSRVSEWVAEGPLHDGILQEWLNEAADSMQSDEAQSLQKACRLFDWTLRNIQLEPNVAVLLDGEKPPSDLPEGLSYKAPGYRQTLSECLWRGTGDGMQRSRVFMALCHQVDVDSFVVGIPFDQGEPIPWLVGVRAGNKIYLFDLTVGSHVPGPDQKGIATLRQAQENESILRRMRVPGVFEYPVKFEDIQNDVVALLDIPVHSFCWRMSTLQRGLTGNRRMKLAYDPEVFKRVEALEEISKAEFWPIGINAKRYQDAIKNATVKDLKMFFQVKSKWGMLDDDSLVYTPGQTFKVEGRSRVDQSNTDPFMEGSQQKRKKQGMAIKDARWRHLCGQFDKQDDLPGARMGYMDQRIPDSDIDNLPFDLEIQKYLEQRRKPGQTQEMYDLQLTLVQSQYRRAKQTASYWLSLIQFDDARYENAATWHQKRVLGRERESPWSAGARYSIARSYEHMGQLEDAVEFYKTDGDPQEHGNRIRARLIAGRQEPSDQ